MARMYSPIVMFAIRNNKNIVRPYGGVIKPICRFRTKMTPKWIGSIPYAATTFVKSGAKISMFAVTSTKQPRMRKRMFRKSRISHGRLVSPVRKSMVASPACRTVMTQPNTPAHAMMRNSTAVCCSDSRRIAGTWRRPMSRYTRSETTSAYATATTDASVAVNTPPRMPPMMITGSMSAGSAVMNLEAKSRAEGIGSLGQPCRLAVT